MADEFPLSFSAFASKLKGTEAEVYTKLVGMLHGQEKHVLSAWKHALEQIRNPTPEQAPAIGDALFPTTPLEG